MFHNWAKSAVIYDLKSLNVRNNTVYLLYRQVSFQVLVFVNWSKMTRGTKKTTYQCSYLLTLITFFARGRNFGDMFYFSLPKHALAVRR